MDSIKIAIMEHIFCPTTEPLAEDYKQADAKIAELDWMRELLGVTDVNDITRFEFETTFGRYITAKLIANKSVRQHANLSHIRIFKHLFKYSQEELINYVHCRNTRGRRECEACDDIEYHFDFTRASYYWTAATIDKPEVFRIYFGSNLILNIGGFAKITDENTRLLKTMPPLAWYLIEHVHKCILEDEPIFPVHPEVMDLVAKGVENRFYVHLLSRKHENEIERIINIVWRKLMPGGSKTTLVS